MGLKNFIATVGGARRGRGSEAGVRDSTDKVQGRRKKEEECCLGGRTRFEGSGIAQEAIERGWNKSKKGWVVFDVGLLTFCL